MAFSTRLKSLRLQHHMTQKMLAKEINVARTTITGYETKNRQPSHEKLQALSDFFGVSVDYLIDPREFEENESAELTLLIQQEKALDSEAYQLYHKLSNKSKEDAIKYMRLLELWEKQQDS